MKAQRMLLGALLIAALASCAGARRSEPVAGPFRPMDAALERGEALFDRHCNKCHVNGEAALGPAINDKPFPKFLMHLQVRVGMGAMPSFKDDEISDEEVRLILDYLKALKRHRGG
ncbi:MAG TPA: cytochrome c [Usitatibacter sp.]|nr:cytochrome c [Usitatibacter sp.]